LFRAEQKGFAVFAGFPSQLQQPNDLRLRIGFMLLVDAIREKIFQNVIKAWTFA